MSKHSIQIIFFFAMSAIVAVLAFFVLKPFLSVLFLAGTFAVIFYPFYKKMLSWVGEKRPGTSAFLTIVAVMVIVLVPLSFLGAQIFKEARNLHQGIQSITDSELGVLNGIEPSSNPFIQKVREQFEGFVTQASDDLGQVVAKGTTWVLNNVSGLFESIGRIVLAIFLWFLSFYYLLRDGHKLKRLLIALSPLSDQYDQEIITKALTSIKSVVGGSLIMAIIQGTLAGVGFAFFGIPNPSIWGALAVIAALIPTVGTAIVTLPAVIYLAFVGNTMSTVGLLIWSVVLVAGIDNILRPKLIERGIKVHPLVILLSVLGGITLFGPIGFLLGPIIMSLLAEFLSIYEHLVLNKQ